jgi:hypothetical protein
LRIVALIDRTVLQAQDKAETPDHKTKCTRWPQDKHYSKRHQTTISPDAIQTSAQNAMGPQTQERMALWMPRNRAPTEGQTSKNNYPYLAWTIQWEEAPTGPEGHE